MAVRIGTSGWHYADWRGTVYPPRLPPGRWLAHLAAEFTTVELNNSFYRLPGRSTFEGWARQVPAGFVFAVKASRYLTHVRRLQEPEPMVERLLEAAEGLGPACGPFLLQLPPNLPADPAALDRTLAAFGGRRVAVELRHPSWSADDVRKVLERRGAACCWADRRGPIAPRWKTTDWGYLRFHEGRASPSPCYGPKAIHSMATEISERFRPQEDVYAYFNNDPGGCAYRNAGALAGITGSSR